MNFYSSDFITKGHLVYQNKRKLDVCQLVKKTISWFFFVVVTNWEPILPVLEQSGLKTIALCHILKLRCHRLTPVLPCSLAAY